MCHFRVQNTLICPEQKFLIQTIIIIIFIYLLALFIGQNLKKILTADPVMSLVSFIHAYLHAKNQIQIFVC